MTYCVAITVNTGIVLASDSRTHAGVDQISTYSKMHQLMADGERMITLLSAGNLATSQAVVRRLNQDLAKSEPRTIKTLGTLAEIAEYVGASSIAEQSKHSSSSEDNFKPEASFILAGQIRGQPHQIYLVYPEGNYIRAASRVPYLQIGELKYGKPILDRIVEPNLDLETAARCALVSMDSTMRSNLSVGPPVDLLIYATDSCRSGDHYALDEDDEYLRQLRIAWQNQLKEAFARLPKLPSLPSHEPRIRLIDSPNER